MSVLHNLHSITINLLFTNEYDISHDDLVPLELLMDTMKDIILSFSKHE